MAAVRWMVQTILFGRERHISFGAEDAWHELLTRQVQPKVAQVHSRLHSRRSRSRRPGGLLLPVIGQSHAAVVDV